MDIGCLCPRQISAWVVSGSEACDLISLPSPGASASAVTLLVVALALLFANCAPKEQVTAIAAGSVGANAGLLVGYAVGCWREGWLMKCFLILFFALINSII